MRNAFVRKELFVGLVIVLLGIGVVPSISGEGWQMFGYDSSRSRYSTSSSTPDTNNILWSYTTGGEIYSSPAVANGKIYIGSYDKKVYCLNASNGELIWSNLAGGYVFSSPAVANGKIYIGSSDGKVYCMDADTGAWIWKYTTGNGIYSSPAVANGKIYIGSSDGKVYCMDAEGNGDETTTKIWDYATGDDVESSPAVANGKIYIGSYDKKVYCLNASNGDHIWNYTTGSEIYSSPAVANGKIYIGSSDENFYCLNASNGELIWSYTTGGEIYSSPAVANGKIYIGSYDKKVYCLDASTGDHIWNYTTGSYVESSPAVANGKIYIGSSDENFYCLNASNGELIWSYTTGGEIYSSPAVADNKVYIGSYNSKVYCFGNHPPVAIDDTANVAKNSLNNQINVRANDYDADGDPLTIASVTPPAHGSSSTDGNYVFYTPNGNYQGPDYFTYMITDISGDNDTAIVTITVNSGGGEPPGGGSEPPGVEPSLNINPIADASAGEPYYGVINTEITFNGSRSHDPDGNITSWYWDFGDGTNDTGMTVTHSYSQKGVYNVTLTVTDNKNNSGSDTTTVIVRAQNKPPSNPTIDGPTTGHKNMSYTYVFLSTDSNNDTIKYTCDWNDGTIESIRFLPNGTSWTKNHSWVKAGRYIIKVTATDNQMSSSSEKTIWIDAMNIIDIGYIIDVDGDGIYDLFHNETNGNETLLGQKDGSYLIDSDGDGEWDHIFSLTNGLTKYEEKGTPGFELIFVICAIVFVLFWKRKRTK